MAQISVGLALSETSETRVTFLPLLALQVVICLLFSFFLFFLFFFWGGGGGGTADRRQQGDCRSEIFMNGLMFYAEKYKFRIKY